MSQVSERPIRSRKPHETVYRLEAEFEERTIRFHVAIRRDDLSTFVIFATTGSSGLYACSMVRVPFLNCVFQTSMVDWATERVVFGETPWLARRDRPEWRAIRRFAVSDTGSVMSLDWLPSVIAEPLLWMLEDSVDQPGWLSDEFF